MEKTSMFLVNQLHNGNFSPINNKDNILICLGIVYHEAFEIWIRYTFLQNSGIQLPPKYTLDFSVFCLHIKNINKRYFAIDRVIDMASHGCPTLNMFNMIKHHPRIFQITPKLHPLD
jgi:hypothetical protein